MEKECDDMKEIRSFVSVLKSHTVCDKLRAEFMHIDAILNAGEALPDDVDLAIKAVRESCAGSSGSVLLPSLEALAGGKKLLEQADEAKSARTEAFSFLHEIAEIRSQIAELREKPYSDKTVSSYKMTELLASKLYDKVPDDHKGLLQDIRRAG